jgi:hypothetical protein
MISTSSKGLVSTISSIYSTLSVEASNGEVYAAALSVEGTVLRLQSVISAPATTRGLMAWVVIYMN